MAEALKGGEESRFDAHALEMHIAAVEVRLKGRWLGMAQRGADLFSSIICNPCNPYVNIICMNPTYEPISASSKLDFP